MATFKVTNVIDGDTFEVRPAWTWGGKSGTRVRPTGFNTPEHGQYGYTEAKNRLTSLVCGKSVELGPGHTVDRGRLVCEVYLNGCNLAAWFPEYAT